MKLIKTFIFLFLLTFTTHAFGKSNEYYQMVITNVLSNCKSVELSTTPSASVTNVLPSVLFNVYGIVYLQCLGISPSPSYYC